jgi:hypothetical protein
MKNAKANLAFFQYIFLIAVESKNSIVKSSFKIEKRTRNTVRFVLPDCHWQSSF